MYHGETRITLWDKTFDIKVFPVTNSKSKEIMPKQLNDPPKMLHRSTERSGV